MTEAPNYTTYVSYSEVANGTLEANNEAWNPIVFHSTALNPRKDSNGKPGAS